MDFRFGATVSQRDGTELGHVRAVVLDPGTQQVVSLVVEHSVLDGRTVLLPIGSLDHSEGDEVYVVLTTDQFDSLPDFSDTQNIAPPPDTEQGEDDITEPFDVPEVPPVGAATGVESIAYTPILQETVNVSAEDSIIDGRTEVWATDGEIGRVNTVVVSDETERLTELIVAEGFIFTHDVSVPAGWIASLQPGRAVLNVDKATVEAGRGE